MWKCKYVTQTHGVLLKQVPKWWWHYTNGRIFSRYIQYMCTSNKYLFHKFSNAHIFMYIKMSNIPNTTLFCFQFYNLLCLLLPSFCFTKFWWKLLYKFHLQWIGWNPCLHRNHLGYEVSPFCVSHVSSEAIVSISISFKSYIFISNTADETFSNRILLKSVLVLVLQ